MHGRDRFLKFLAGALALALALTMLVPFLLLRPGLGLR